MADLRWFTNDRDLAELSDGQVRFLEAVDGLLARLDPPGASRSRSYWSAEPRAKGAGRGSYTLWICIAAAATKVWSLQVGYATDRFVGGWDDPNYVWDHPTVLLDRETRPAEPEDDIAEILTWIGNSSDGQRSSFADSSAVGGNTSTSWNVPGKAQQPASSIRRRVHGAGPDRTTHVDSGATTPTTLDVLPQEPG